MLGGIPVFISTYYTVFHLYFIIIPLIMSNEVNEPCKMFGKSLACRVVTLLITL